MLASTLATALAFGSILGAGVSQAAAAYDVKLSKSYASLTVKKSEGAVKCETVKVSIKKSKGVKIKKVVCKADKGGIVTANIKGKVSPVLTVKAS